MNKHQAQYLLKHSSFLQKKAWNPKAIASGLSAGIEGLGSVGKSLGLYGDEAADAASAASRSFDDVPPPFARDPYADDLDNILNRTDDLWADTDRSWPDWSELHNTPPAAKPPSKPTPANSWADAYGEATHATPSAAAPPSKPLNSWADIDNMEEYADLVGKPPAAKPPAAPPSNPSAVGTVHSYPGGQTIRTQKPMTAAQAQTELDAGLDRLWANTDVKPTPPNPADFFNKPPAQ